MKRPSFGLVLLTAFVSVVILMNVIGRVPSALQAQQPKSASSASKVEDIVRLVQNCEFSKATKLIEFELQNKAKLSASEIKILQKNLSDIRAIERDYTLTHDAVYNKLKVKIPDLSEADMNKWEKDYSLEYYLIDGIKRYFSNCIYDLFQVNKEVARRAKVPEKEDYDAARYPAETINSFENGSVLSKKIDVAFSFFISIGSFPEGALLRAWIPYVRDNQFQSNINILHSTVNKIRLPKVVSTDVRNFGALVSLFS